MKKWRHLTEIVINEQNLAALCNLNLLSKPRGFWPCSLGWIFSVFPVLFYITQPSKCDSILSYDLSYLLRGGVCHIMVNFKNHIRDESNMAEPERQQQSKIPSIIVECLWAGLFLGVAYLSAQQAWKIHRSPGGLSFMKA